MAQHTERTARRWQILPLLAAALIIAFVATGVTASAPETLPVHAAVSQWAEQHPGQSVPLIVQHDGSPDGLRSFVLQSGGTIEREFHIIPAFDVAIPAGQLDELARQSDVSWISLDAPVLSTVDPAATTSATAAALATVYPESVHAPDVWPQATGAGVTVAVIDTGVSSDTQQDYSDGAGGLRLQWTSPNASYVASGDGFGHGSHVGGIVAGSSTATAPTGKYIGIAPGANVLAVRLADDEGNATVGDLMASLQWVDDNRFTHNIRAVNLSVSSSVAQSYEVDPLDAAVEILWFHDIVVLVAAGNIGDVPDAVYYPPANDPFVITVGGFDDMGTPDLNDDQLATWSSRGQTQDGFAKPDVLGPGANIVSPISPSSYLATHYSQYIVERAGSAAYFRMSGTSMATPAVSGVVALLLQAHPDWKPGEVKYVLTQTARSVSGSGKGVLADAAINFSGGLQNSDDGLRPNHALLAAFGVAEADFNGIRWRNANFNGIRWAGLELNGIRWTQVDWSGIRWAGLELNGIRWASTDFNGIRWTGIRWTAYVLPSECNDHADTCGMSSANRSDVGCAGSGDAISQPENRNVTVPESTACTVTTTVNGNFYVTGTLILDGATIKGNIVLDGGALEGSGTVLGNIECDPDLGGTNAFAGSLTGNDKC